MTFRPGVVVVPVADEVVVWVEDTAALHLCAGTAALLLRALHQGVPPADLARHVRAQFGSCPPDLTSDVDDFLEQLRQLHVLP